VQRYNPKEIESKWRNIWDETGIYTANLQTQKPTYLAMSMFNYPSGAGIHIGHAMNYTISDVKARFKRQQGYESYHPVGWDAFGLPAENYAIKAGVSPQVSMANIIPGYHKQYKAMGWSNDWEKEIATHLPEYYKWTQWIFVQMHKAGLAYQDSRMQWWCELDNSVLANEQVIDGKCWRHDGPNDPPVGKKEVKQWFFKITEYADELLEAIDDLDWTESVKLAQKNWIGRSKGAEITFALADHEAKIKVFTTRPDTLFGVTFMVMAPEHELVERITTEEQRSAVDAYVKETQLKSELERQESKDKTGVFTGAYAINPVNGEKIPVWIADYVLTGYGTGAIMAVPAHDERDHEFAQKFNLPIRQVIAERFVHEGNEHHPESPLVPREVVCVVVKHPTKDEYLIAKPHGSEFWSPVMGGIDEGESAIDTAKRELLEESGYADIASAEERGDIIASEFYAQHKQVNRIAYIRTVLVQLGSLDKLNEKAIDKDEQELKWATKSEVQKLCVGAGAKEVYEMAAGMERPMVLEGRLINSGQFTGFPSSEAREKIVDDLTKNGVGESKTNYKMRDWSVSRQRYWGAPIPIIDCKNCGAVLVPDEELPVILPELTDFKPAGDGRSALARATDWLKVDCPQCGGPAERETDTLDTYIDSSWYMYRYMDPHNQAKIFDSEQVNKWAPVDFYNGGDHATAHLLYARFIARFFTKIGLVNDPEPFKQMLFNGKVTAKDGTMFSKSKGNGIDPLEIINQGYGADALRTYLMFAAPLELWARWDPQGVPGTHRFLSRLWNLVQEYTGSPEQETDEKTRKELLVGDARMVKKITEDIENNRYNTAIAAAMGQLNDLYKLKTQSLGKNAEWQQALEHMVACIAPFAPHIADELWQQLGHHTSIHRDSWPEWDEAYLVGDTVTIAVQVNGKLRGEITLPKDSVEAEVVQAAQADEKVVAHLDGKKIRKTIYVPGRLVNFVV
jgi:leucyl-tRNA synthetase